nr:MAG TPA: hypothetical protein [Caudoviricetes sp.]
MPPLIKKIYEHSILTLTNKVKILYNSFKSTKNYILFEIKSFKGSKNSSLNFHC